MMNQVRGKDQCVSKIPTELNKFLDKLLSVLSSFTLIFLLCYLVLVTRDLKNAWTVINDSTSIIKKQDKKIRHLQKLFIKMNKNKRISL